MLCKNQATGIVVTKSNGLLVCHVYCNRFIKRLNVDLKLQLSEQKRELLPDYTFKSRAPFSTILMLTTACCTTRVLLYAKMLKEPKTEKTIGCVVTIFIIGGISSGGLSSLTTPMVGRAACVRMTCVGNFEPVLNLFDSW